MEIAELPPEQPEEPQEEPREEPPPEPPQPPEEPPQPKRRGRPRKPDVDLKRPRRVKAPEPEPEPPEQQELSPAYTDRQLETATWFFAQQLASLQARSDSARRERWRALFK